MLVHRPFAQSIGGFDIHLGPGMSSVGTGEDAEFFDRILRSGGNVHHAPAAVVHHERSMTQKALRKYVYNRAAGRAAILASRAFGYGDTCALQRLLVGLPRELMQQATSGLARRSPYPFSLALLELRATFAAPFRYAWAKLTTPRAARPVTTTSIGRSAADSSSGDPPAPIKPKLAA
jgi:GT2 family glycosyltransferase